MRHSLHCQITSRIALQQINLSTDRGVVAASSYEGVRVRQWRHGGAVHALPQLEGRHRQQVVAVPHLLMSPIQARVRTASCLRGCN